ncbi:hypothetical protein GEMRC1_007975 [Eukaryota sp. GEM-RC1]
MEISEDGSLAHFKNLTPLELNPPGCLYKDEEAPYLRSTTAKEQLAAIVIQRAFRRFRCLQRFSFINDPFEYDRCSCAAVIIQKAIRAHRERSFIHSTIFEMDSIQTPDPPLILSTDDFSPCLRPVAEESAVPPSVPSPTPPVSPHNLSVELTSPTETPNLSVSPDIIPSDLPVETDPPPRKSWFKRVFCCAGDIESREGQDVHVDERNLTSYLN